MKFAAKTFFKQILQGGKMKKVLYLSYWKNNSTNEPSGIEIHENGKSVYHRILEIIAGSGERDKKTVGGKRKFKDLKRHLKQWLVYFELDYPLNGDGKVDWCDKNGFYFDYGSTLEHPNMAYFEFVVKPIDFYPSKKKVSKSNIKAFFEKMDKHKRVGRRGKILQCPKCLDQTRVFHLAWAAKECEGCGAMIDKYKWKIEVSKNKK